MYDMVVTGTCWISKRMYGTIPVILDRLISMATARAAAWVVIRTLHHLSKKITTIPYGDS